MKRPYYQPRHIQSPFMPDAGNRPSTWKQRRATTFLSLLLLAAVAALCWRK